jgi:hypothetical protein
MNKEERRIYWKNWYSVPENKRKQNARSFASRNRYAKKYRYVKKTRIPKEMMFWAKVEFRGENECWPWLAGRYPSGYGHSSRTEYSHRVAYRLSKGKIPRGFHVCHSCDNPPCCNPAHLWVGTAKSNMIDRDRKGRDRYSRSEIHNNTRCK